MFLSRAMMDMRHGYANLNEGGKWWEKKYDVAPETRPFGDPDVAHQMEREYHEELGIVWSYGGWMEIRDCIRRGTYLEKDKLWLHTGIDINVDEGVVVHAPTYARVMYKGNDAPLVGGWGVHVIVLTQYRGAFTALLLAHLGEVRASLRQGYLLDKGERIGTVGDTTVNGGWRPHLHVQQIAVGFKSETEAHAHDWEQFSEELDGYVPPAQRARWSRICPDPTHYLFSQ